ncbi:hypothetical protein OSH11_22670 [Kaistia dalseonensis]|uniref:Uncharacterized protein n=1 Tax=Kaistia dalseonensis TaxID=410840 RepID=A0ABU0HD06_9HYPH|nr:hypothetical protein [Kaistia dalseonensis]MCX5497521.1 hypothetical protein [Kaistia dalseonensis]MDQ0440160.1 hypothetical protein [Kaistia dalseonensis]
MTQNKHPHFKSKAEREQDNALQAQYRELGNPELVAAIKQQKKAQPQPQMQAKLDKPERE